MNTSTNEKGKITTRDFYQKATSPVVTIPENLIHHDVEQKDADFTEIARPPFFIADLPSKTMAVTVGTLQPAQQSGRHRHSYETIMYIIAGEGFTMIEDVKVDWKAGDAVYVPVWSWHYNVNTNQINMAKYVSCDNAPLLHAVGLAMFEPAP
ncbi:gentisate 1,2-dioxygenase [Mucilaginibacter lappiensis]|uniref:Mannose-6-phosphate isomerase-like protein (Cupin superfamily) n=1 Tax=Mucilaginibacter lappiensis TaxID=354630 RepID=A0ABR6PDC3_9SPHI|nr:cupin domain-containing protein [Mucilaginibacter lappiensis]MBB6107756.1 mannose-6-phosphate isomerase-like protein (cupin superfamily) [Mucilaginibacter lappiensis]SIP98104.1 gentisate 1,2-dioxygenase [Mucilaginibacter lappiensis]